MYYMGNMTVSSTKR